MPADVDIVQIQCPKCKKIKSSKLISSVNVKEKKEYKKKIMDGTIFEFKCPSCKYTTEITYNFLYHDPDEKIFIALLPKFERSRIICEGMAKMFPKIKGYKKRIVRDINEMREKILIFDNGLDDFVIEETKANILKHTRKDVKANIQALYFCMYDKKNEQISFLVQLKDNEKYYYSISTKAYEKSKEAIKGKNFARNNKKYFVNTQRSIDLIKGNKTGKANH